MTQRIRSIVVNSAVLCVTVLVLIAMLEVLLRFTGIERIESRTPHLHQASDIEGVHYEFIPNLNNVRGYNWERISTNSLGFRGKEFDPQKPTIALIGDSFAFGFGVNDDETHAAVLEKQFPSYNILNTGVNGYNIEQEARAYMAKFSTLRPDIAIVEFVFNDMSPASVLTEETSEVMGGAGEVAEGTQAGLWLPGKAVLQNHSAVFRFIERRTKWLPFRAKDPEYGKETITEQDLMLYETWFTQLDDALQSDKKLFVIWPEGRWNETSRAALTKMAEDRGYVVIDLYDTYGLTMPHLYWDWHPNADVHATVGRILSEKISESGWAK